MRIRGQIADIDGQWWAVISDDGQDHWVMTDRLTRYGTSTQRVSRAWFKTGARALIIARANPGALTATRVAPDTPDAQ